MQPAKIYHEFIIAQHSAECKCFGDLGFSKFLHWIKMEFRGVQEIANLHPNRRPQNGKTACCTTEHGFRCAKYIQNLDLRPCNSLLLRFRRREGTIKPSTAPPAQRGGRNGNKFWEESTYAEQFIGQRAAHAGIAWAAPVERDQTGAHLLSADAAGADLCFDFLLSADVRPANRIQGL